MFFSLANGSHSWKIFRWIIKNSIKQWCYIWSRWYCMILFIHSNRDSEAAVTSVTEVGLFTPTTSIWFVFGQITTWNPSWMKSSDGPVWLWLMILQNRSHTHTGVKWCVTEVSFTKLPACRSFNWADLQMLANTANRRPDECFFLFFVKTLEWLIAEFNESFFLWQWHTHTVLDSSLVSSTVQWENTNPYLLTKTFSLQMASFPLWPRTVWNRY